MFLPAAPASFFHSEEIKSPGSVLGTAPLHVCSLTSCYLIAPRPLLHVTSQHYTRVYLYLVSARSFAHDFVPDFLSMCIDPGRRSHTVQRTSCLVAPALVQWFRYLSVLESL
jgi:hypothetical protein